MKKIYPRVGIGKTTYEHHMIKFWLQYDLPQVLSRHLGLPFVLNAPPPQEISKDMLQIPILTIS